MKEMSDAETAQPSVALVRIFLSSPGDVAEERARARRLIESELPKIPALRGRLALEVIAWDDPAAQIPMLATKTPQESVNAARPRPADCDIVIVILWSRMGTPLPDNLRKPNGEPYLSGTEWEYEDVVKSPRKPPPQVLVYRRSQEPLISLRDPKKKEKEEQFERVEAFFAQFRNPDGSLKGGVNEYETPSDFKVLLRQHLEEMLYRRLPRSAANHQVRPIRAEIPPAYYTWLRRRFEKVELLDAKGGHAVTLDHVYVPAMTRPPPPLNMGKHSTEMPHKEQDPIFLSIALDLYERYSRNRRTKKQNKQRRMPERQKLIPLLQRLDTESLYVWASVGAGKSIFCRWATLQSIPGTDLLHPPVPASQEFAEPEPRRLRGRLPLLIELREFWRRMDCGPGERTWHRMNLEKALAAWVDASRPGGLNSELLAVHLKTGSTFLLFDGLDEVPPHETRSSMPIYPRELLLTGLADALPDWHKAGNRILLTSRPYGLDEAGVHRLGLPSALLEPLPKALQDLFVTRWFNTLGKPKKISDLIATIHGREDLALLAENPMLLTALCVFYESGGRLPEDRYEFHKSMVKKVLDNRFLEDAKERVSIERRLEAVALGMHTGECAGALRVTPVAEISWIEVERLLARFAKSNSFYEKVEVEVEAAVRREQLLNHSGLLVPQPKDRATFYHLSFQEFLAAQRLARTVNSIDKVFRERSTAAEWRPTLLFLFAAQIAIKDVQWGLGLLDRLSRDQDRAVVKTNSLPALFIAEALHFCLVKGYVVSEQLKERFHRLCLDAIEDEIELQARQALGLWLGRLGDPRVFDLRDLRAYVEVPAGVYPDGNQWKMIQTNTPFQLGRYPVTNSQYQAFLDEGGYGERKWWSEAGWSWRQQNGVIDPLFWRDQRWNGPNQPVVGVSFWEAEACSTWAGGHLPREDQWEAAARGAQEFAYPWGNNWEDGICNSQEIGLGVTSPVGLFSRSRQAELGIEDLAGNVFEWCVSFPKQRGVLRGGSWGSNYDDTRSANLYWSKPDIRNNFIGFRVACSSSSSGRLSLKTPA